MPRKPLDNEEALQNITLPEARCQEDRGINAHLPFVHTPIFVKNHFFEKELLGLREDGRRRRGHHHGASAPFV